MKTPLLLFFSLLMSCILSAQDLSSLRARMSKAEQNAKEANAFSTEAKLAYQKSPKPIYLAFDAVGNFFLAKHVGNPLKKLSYFRKGKEQLAKAVALDNNNLEIRLLRYLSQKESPSFLGYKDHMKEDYQFLKNNYAKSKDPELVKAIQKFIY